MKKTKFVFALLAVFAGLIITALILVGENSLIFNPKGIIAQSERNVIVTTYVLMFIVTIPTLILLFIVAWKYRSKNTKATYDPEHYSKTGFIEIVLWVAPSIVIVVMTFFTWRVTHELDPYQPIKSETKPLTIQVVALDWKWLFIYPDLGIAAVNFVQFPEKTPIRFELAADGSPMNSFWIPQLSGQIYAMTGMVTPLHIMANESGKFAGRAAEINGEGYSGMTFVAVSSTQSDFEKWVTKVKKSPFQLTIEAYDDLFRPSTHHPVVLYSHVDNDLFKKIVMKYMPTPSKRI